MLTWCPGAIPIPGVCQSVMEVESSLEEDARVARVIWQSVSSSPAHAEWAGNSLSKGEKLAHDLKATLAAFKNHKLGDEKDESELSKQPQLVNLRHMLGLLANKFLSMYASRLLKDLDIRPKKAAKQRQATRTETYRDICGARRKTRWTPPAGQALPLKSKSKRPSHVEKQHPQELHHHWHHHWQSLPPSQNQLQPRHQAHRTTIATDTQEGGAEDTEDNTEEDAEEKELARQADLLQDLLGMTYEQLKQAAETTGLPLVDETGNYPSQDILFLQLVDFYELEELLYDSLP